MLGFELELYSPSEYCMVYWYLYAVLTKLAEKTHLKMALTHDIGTYSNSNYLFFYQILVMVIFDNLFVKCKESTDTCCYLLWNHTPHPEKRKKTKKEKEKNEMTRMGQSKHLRLCAIVLGCVCFFVSIFGL